MIDWPRQSWAIWGLRFCSLVPKVTLAIKTIYFWARPIKITYPNQNSIFRRCKKEEFETSKKQK